MKYCFWIFTLIIILACKENNAENGFSQTLDKKLLDAIAVDSFAAPFGFKTLDFYKTDVSLKVPALGYKTYSNYGFGEEFIVKGKDTLRLVYDVAFTNTNLIQKIENSKSKNEYFYDDQNNLVLRRLMSKNKDESSTIDRFSYDSYGNLKSYYRYSIKPNGTYKLDHYKEYVYSENNDGITVTIKGIEGWSSYHTTNVTKKFDKDKRIVSEMRHEYSPLLMKDVSYIKDYKHINIGGNYYVSEQKAYTSAKPDETVTKFYQYNEDGKQTIAIELEKMPKYTLEYKVIKEYSNHNLKQSVSSANSDQENRVEMYPAKKNGLQETYKYFYNQQNDLVKQEHTIHTGKKEDYDVTTSVFEYDKEGNWNYKKQLQKYPNIKYDADYNDGSDGSEIFVRNMDYSKNYIAPAIPKIEPEADRLKREILEKHPLK